MIAIMRRVLQGNLHRIFLWAFLAFFIIGGLSVIDFSKNSKDIITVYTHGIEERKFYAQLASARKQQEYFRQHGIFLADQQDPHKDVIKQNVSNMLLEYWMDSVGIVIPDDVLDKEVQRRLQSFPAHFFDASGNLDTKILERAIAPSTIDDFMDEIAFNAKLEVMHGIIEGAAYVSDFELHMKYNEDFANKTYSVVTIPFQKILAKVKNEKIDEKKLQKFFKKSSHAEKYKTAEKRAGRMWRFDQKSYGITVSDKAVKDYYNKNKNTYLQTPAQVTVRQIVFGIEKGKSDDARAKAEEAHEALQKEPKRFEEFAKKLSTDKATASKGGLLPAFDRNDKERDKVLVTAAFEQLTDDGQVSSVIKTKDAYVILQRVSRQKAVYKELKSVAKDIKEKLEQEKFKKRFMQDASRIISQSAYNKDALQGFVDKKGAKMTAIDLSERKPQVEYMQLFKVSGLGKYTTFFDKDTGVLVECTQLEKPVLPKLDTIRKKVESDYQRDLAKQRMTATVKEAAKAAKNLTMKRLADKFDGSAESATFTFKDGKVEESSILKNYAIRKKIHVLQQPESIIGVEADRDGYIIKLEAIDQIDPKLFAEKKESLQGAAGYTSRHKARDSFIASLYRNAKLDNKIYIDKKIAQS